MVEPCWNHSLMTLLVSFYVIPATAFSYQPRPSPGDPRGRKARPLGTPSLVQTGRKTSRNVVFPETSPEKCLTFKDVYIILFMFFVLIFASKPMAGIPKKNGRSQGSMISSNNIRQLRLKRSPTAWTMPIGERSGATEKTTLQRVAVGWSNWTPLDLEQPHWDLEFFPVHSDEWHVATRRNAEMHHVLMTHPVSNFAAWYLSWNVELQTALCKEGNEHRRDKCLYKSQMSCKGWVPINVEP